MLTNNIIKWCVNIFINGACEHKLDSNIIITYVDIINVACRGQKCPNATMCLSLLIVRNFLTTRYPQYIQQIKQKGRTTIILKMKSTQSGDLFIQACN